MKAVRFVAILSAALAAPALAQTPQGLSEGRTFEERGGEALYAHVCAACHQADGGGAIGAGAYPALANDPRLISAQYVATLVLRGRAGMPPVGVMMNDDQVADVVNYAREHFGGFREEPISAAAIKALRSAPVKNP